MSTKPIVSVTDATKDYGRRGQSRPALRGVNLAVAPGEWVAVVGPSGCGKSTLLHLVGGLDVPDSGSVAVAGDDVTTMSAAARAVMRRRRIGIVFQSYNLVPYLDAVANVELSLRVAGIGRRAARDRASEVLEAVGMSEFANALPATLSGGQQQRVAVARALATRPDVLLADEPTGALDSEASHGVIGLLRAERERGQTILMVTHDYAVAAAADRMVFLRDGHVVDVRRPSSSASDSVGTDAGMGAGTGTGTGIDDIADLLGLGNW
jgi:putative ABC transport system ATP-binding protein